jgi:hypothetical protein
MIIINTKINFSHSDLGNIVDKILIQIRNTELVKMLETSVLKRKDTLCDLVWNCLTIKKMKK